jgi:hypothetical protein
MVVLVPFKCNMSAIITTYTIPPSRPAWSRWKRLPVGAWVVVGAASVLALVLSRATAQATPAVCGSPFACAENTQVALPTATGTLSGSFYTNGTLSGDFYTNSLTCMWNVSAPVGRRLVVWFTLIDIEFQAFCGCVLHCFCTLSPLAWT